MKKSLTFLSAASVAGLLVLAIGCGKPHDSLVAAIDKHGDEIMESAAKAEAREWMKATNHIFFKEDPKQVAQYVEDFYQAGADRVLIADIEEEQGFEYGEALLIVLPKDPAVRTKLFQVGSRADTDFQNDSVSDQGQKYLYYSLD
jgi:hypothetical protein